MQWVIHSLLVLAICEPLFLDAKKVVIVMPRHQRRSHAAPWSQLRHFKKNGFPSHAFAAGPKYGISPGGGGPQLYRPRELHFAKDQYPQGGDDFDQGHEEVNHVMVPHGKGITHAVSFGKGYIPFDTYKDHRPAASHHHNYPADHHSGPSGLGPSGPGLGPSGPAGIGPSGPHLGPSGPSMIYPSGPGYAQAYLSQQADAYLGNDDTSNDNDQDKQLQDRVQQDRAAQNYAAGKSLYDTTNTPSPGGHFPGQGITSKPSGGVFMPAGIPSATIGGSKTGIVLRDSIAFDDYNRRVEELTKNWPASFAHGNHLVPGALGVMRHAGVQQLHAETQQQHFDGSGFAGGANFQHLGQRQGYEVKEDVVDTPPDFRTMPIQTSPVHQPQQNIQYIHQPVQQSVQQSVQHVFSQSQAMPQFSQGYGAATNNYHGFLHG